MKALCWHGKKDIRCDTVPDPKIEEPRDAIVKMTSCAICGSDLHLFGGFIPAWSPATSWATSSWAKSSRSARTTRS
jgi:threonine dehydrogenase-like Zn-dependent dehydrogenase